MTSQAKIPPAGTTAASVWAPGAFADPAAPPGILADDIDPKTGDVRSLLSVGVDPVDAAIAYQFGLTRGAGEVLLDQGQALRTIKKNDDAAPAAIRFEVLRVMAPFVARGDAVVERVEVRGGPASGDVGAAYLTYRNTRTGKSPTIKVTP